MRLDRMKLRMEMYRRDMTQVQLAKITGYSRQYISNVVRGLSCGEKAAVCIAEALGVSLDEIKEV